MEKEALQKKTTIVDNDESQREIKKKLLSECLKTQKRLAETARTAMIQAQESAIEEEATQEEKFEGSKAQCQADRDMYARQYQEALEGFNFLNKIDVSRKYDSVMLGAVVITDVQNLFIAISIGELKIDNKPIFAISPLTPLFRAMTGKKKGETFSFRNKTFTILDLY